MPVSFTVIAKESNKNRERERERVRREVEGKGEREENGRDKYQTSKYKILTVQYMYI